MADIWNKQAVPWTIQQKATKRLPALAKGFMTTAQREMGVNVFMLVSYRNAQRDGSISMFETEGCGFTAEKPDWKRELGSVLAMWRDWAEDWDTPEDNDAENDDEAERGEDALILARRQDNSFPLLPTFTSSTVEVDGMRNEVMPPSAQLPTVPGSFIVAPPGIRKAAGYVYEILPSITDASPSLPDHHSGPPDLPRTTDDFRDVSLPQPNLVPASGGFVGRKCAATSSGPVEPLHAFPATQALTSPHRTSSYAVPDLPAHPATPARSIRSNRTAPPASSHIASNPLLHCSVTASAHTPSPGQSRSLSLRTRDSHAAWAAAEGLLPIPDAFKTPGYVPTHIVGGITYDIRAPRPQQPKPAGPDIMPDHLFTPSGSSRHPSERPQRGSRLAPAISAIPSSHAHNFASHSHVPGPVHVHTNDSDPRSPSFANHPPSVTGKLCEFLPVHVCPALPIPFTLLGCGSSHANNSFSMHFHTRMEYPLHLWVPTLQSTLISSQQ
ncbi:hypothetical protein BYT27DRAFT_7209305 [Phlegmacium glaucopus]|nr:hypothetical protein BYT27DRAFT_7209305 [Phlegmacium glaucopus]